MLEERWVEDEEGLVQKSKGWGWAIHFHMNTYVTLPTLYWKTLWCEFWWSSLTETCSLISLEDIYIYICNYFLNAHSLTQITHFCHLSVSVIFWCVAVLIYIHTFHWIVIIFALIIVVSLHYSLAIWFNSWMFNQSGASQGSLLGA